MKKLAAVILLLCMVLSLAACGNEEITMQEIYDANRTEALLQNHESVYIRTQTDGENWSETYLTKDYAYDYIQDEEFSFVQFMTDDACYYDDAGDRLLFLFITPDGVGDFASERAERYASVIVGEDAFDENIESVSKKDSYITVTSVLSSKNLETWAENGVTAGKLAYVLDAKTHEMTSIISDYTLEDGSALDMTTEMTYDAEVPEMLKEFLAYVNQTEDLRNVTVVSNPGTDQEESKSIQAPKGLIVGFEYDEDLEYAVEFYTDAACTEAYDPYADTDSDLTVYVKWAEEESETPEITLQEIYDSSNVPTLLEAHDSVYVVCTENGEVTQEMYCSKEENYAFYKGEEFDNEFLVTDHSSYMRSNELVRLILLTPDGMADMKDVFAKENEWNVFTESLLNDTITSVTEKDGQIIVTSLPDQEEIDSIEGLISYEEELVLDAKTREPICVKSNFIYEDKEVEGIVTFTYDAPILEKMKAFMEYDRQTEDLRTITVISDPGTENEKTQSIQLPKGLIGGLTSTAEYGDRTFTIYTDAACTQILEEAPDVNSDVTVYIKWDE